MIKIQNLTVKAKDKIILTNINLEFEVGKTYAILGQNGSGKSTLAQIISGNPDYTAEINSQILINNDSNEAINILDLSPDKRSHLGIFVSMQYPNEITGVNLLSFLKTIIQINRKNRNLDKLSTKQTLDLINLKLEKIGWSKEFLGRNLNEGMSGGERKKCEILQMLLLDSRLIILDEIDSGLDKQALDKIITIIKEFMNPNKTFVIITHQQKILDLIKPDKIIKIEKGKVLN